MRGPLALVRHMDEPNPGLLREHFAEQVRRRARAPGAVRQADRLLLRVRNELAHIVERRRRRRDERGPVADRELRERREVPERIVGDGLLQDRVVDVGERKGDEESGAVRGRLGDEVGGERAARSRLRFHDDRLLPAFAQLFRI